MLFVPRAAKLNATELVVGADRVIRRRLPADSRCSAVAIFDVEGELFFGAAPELERVLDRLRDAVAKGARIAVLRLRRARTPDLVCLERLEHFLGEMNDRGVPVLLSGVREDLARTMSNLAFDRWLPRDRVFASEPTAPGSSTIDAVRRAYEIAATGGPSGCAHCAGVDALSAELYYMV